VSLASLVRRLIPLPELRKLATAHGLKPKGFRVERAKAEQLASLLAEQFLTNERLQEELAQRLADATRVEIQVSEPATKSDVTDTALSYRLERAQRDAETQRASARKARKSLQESVEQRDEARRQIAELTRRIAELERVRDVDRRELLELRARCSELERDSVRSELDQLRKERDEWCIVDVNQRRTIAELSTRARELELLVAELESYLPRGQKERLRLKRRDQASEVTVAGWLPCYTDEFLRSLSELEAEALRRVHTAVAQLILHGPEYPGLHAKALKGTEDLWSIRAGVHHRVYFQRDGNRVILQHAGTREDQETYLKKHLQG